MAKDEFRLEQVLKYRKEAERVRQLELAAARLEQESAQDRLKNERSALDKLSREYSQRQLDGIDAAELQLFGNFTMRKKKEIRGIRESLVGLEKVVQEKRDLLVAAAKEKKALEVFKEKKMRDLQQERMGKERDFLDEIAVQNHGGKK